MLRLGIQLIVVAAPSSAAIIPEQLLVQCAAGARALRKSLLEQWKQELSAAGERDFLWISGWVRAATAVPKAAGLPYSDAVICIHLDSVTAAGQRLPDSVEPDSVEPDSVEPDREVIVYTWGLKNRRLVADQRFVAGAVAVAVARVTLRVQPWERVRSQYERYYWVELEDPGF